ncbi:MAG: sugar transferase, partial [Casimicrobiaceae bacterium]
MVRLFNHWFPSNTILQIAFDAILLFITFMLAAIWINRGNLADIDLMMPVAILFAVAMVLLNSVIGLYQRDPYRTGAQTAARILLALIASLPVAYGVFQVLPWGETHQDELKFAAIGALAMLLVLRGYLTHWGSAPLFVRRVLVFGTGAEAAAVEHSLRQFGPSMNIVGFYPVSTQEAAGAVGADKVFPGALPLAETARQNHVDDLIVAVRERRGGALPLNDLLQ